MTDAYDAWRLGEARDSLLELCGFRAGAETTADGSAQNDLASERVEAIMVFVGLAKAHSLPRKLLPNGTRTDDWLPPGTRVNILGRHAGIVTAEADRVLVKMDGLPDAVSFPRTAVVREGQEWNPPTRTPSPSE